MRDGEFLVALDVTAGRRGETAEARIRMASAVERGWLQTDAHARSSIIFDRDTGAVRADRRATTTTRSSSVEHPVAADPLEAARIAGRRLSSRGLCSRPTSSCCAALRFAGVDIDLRALAERAASGARALKDRPAGER